mmetsp:Transcript_11406/g.21897  ORF Transcript_11406/g.21897 Transcript_11406/m.21897 type:complete len:143 (-) Transcript_11406:219-647(-)
MGSDATRLIIALTVGLCLEGSLAVSNSCREEMDGLSGMRPMGQGGVAEPNFFPVSNDDATKMQMYSQWWWDKYLEFYQSGAVMRWWQRVKPPPNPNPHVHVLQQLERLRAMRDRSKLAGGIGEGEHGNDQQGDGEEDGDEVR